MTHGKSYLVTPRTGENRIYRGGKFVGSFPEIGFSVQIFGVCSGSAGTELAAHAIAEVYRDISPNRRQWVLTEEEYDENNRILREHGEALLAAYPYTSGEAEAARRDEERYAKINEEGEKNIRRKLMNLSPYENVIWDPNPRPRPKEFPKLPEEETSPGMKM